MRILLFTSICSLLLLEGLAAQSKEATSEMLLQKCIDFEILEQHMANNPVIRNHKRGNNIYLNKWVDTTWQFYKHGERLGYARPKYLLEDRGYAYKFEKVKVRKRKAEIIFWFLPNFYWGDRKGFPLYGVRAERVHFRVSLFFEKPEDDWEISDYKIEDPSFESRSNPKVKAFLEENYIPFNK